MDDHIFHKTGSMRRPCAVLQVAYVRGATTRPESKGTRRNSPTPKRFCKSTLRIQSVAAYEPTKQSEAFFFFNKPNNGKGEEKKKDKVTMVCC